MFSTPPYTSLYHSRHSLDKGRSEEYDPTRGSETLTVDLSYLHKVKNFYFYTITLKPVSSSLVSGSFKSFLNTLKHVYLVIEDLVYSF